MGVYKRGKTWFLDYYYPPGRDGKRVREKVGPKKDEARILLAQRLEDIRQGRDPRLRTIKPKPFTAAVAEFLEKHARTRRDYRTFDKRAGILKAHFGEMMLQEITPAKVEDFRNARLAAGVGKSTTNRDRATLSAIFNFAIRRGEFGGENPVKSVKAFRESRGRLRFLSGDEADALIAASEGHLQRAIISALHTGGRLSEVLALKWEDISAGAVHFRAENTKSGKGREVPISREFSRHLETWGKVRNISGYLFTWGGKPVKSIRTGFLTAREDAKLGKDVTFHTLRHTFASWYMMNGGDLYRLKEYLGHSTITLTERYAHLSPDHLRNGAEFIGAPRDGARSHTVDTNAGAGESGVA